MVPYEQGNWMSVSSGLYPSLALRDDHTLWAWGWSDSGRLGNGQAGYTDWFLYR
ncbi:MAG: hypothetical protein ACOX2W_01220 [Desulfomonilia bacterium]